MRWLSFDAGLGSLGYVGDYAPWFGLIVPTAIYFNLDGPTPELRRPAWRLGLEASALFYPVNTLNELTGKWTESLRFGGILLGLSAGIVFH